MPRASVFATIGAVLLVFVTLQVWRPYFFLTDDNMSGVLPEITDLGQTLRHGEIPQTTPSLYAASYRIWRDPGNLSLLFPIHLAGLLLASTRFRFASIDAIALFHLLVGALAMQACVRAFCRRFERPLAAWMTCFLGVSYVASYYSLAIGSSWYNFLGNQAALPIVALGLILPRRRDGGAVAAAGMFYSLLGGHLAPFLFSALFLGLFAIALSIVTRKWEPLWRFLIGSVVAVLILSPVLVSFFSGFLGSGRNAVLVTTTVANNLSFPAAFLGATLGVDSIGQWDFAPVLGYLAEVSLPLTFSAAAVCFLFVLGTVLKFRRLEWSIVAMLVLVALFMQRPLWLQAIVAQLPFFRSLRWPMREAMVFIFFLHLLIALGWHRLRASLRLIVPPVSALAFALPLFLLPSPTFNRFPVDRALLLSRRAEQVWQEVRRSLSVPTDSLVVPLLNRALYEKESRAFISRAPHTLLGAYNYPALFGMRSSTGYTMPGFERPFRSHTPILWPGYFVPEQFSESDLDDPHLLFTWLRSTDPVTIDYRLNGQRLRASFPNGIEKAGLFEKLP